MKICIAVQSYRFNKRLCWMLSSILQQVPRKVDCGLPEIEVKVSFLSDIVTGQKVNELLSVFRDLRIHRKEYAGREGFKYRGEIRNADLINPIFHQRDIDADWILWADSDMVYPPTFFGELGHLLRTDFKKNKHCLHSQRKSTFLEPTEELINKYTYPCIIPNAFEQANALDGVLKANIGAGYCQIANVENLFKNHGGMYCTKKNCDRDWDNGGQKARSDQVFRRMIGHEKIPLPIQIHLQHSREFPDERDC